MLYINIVEEEISNIINILFDSFIINNKLKNIISKNKNISDINNTLVKTTNEYLKNVDIDKIKSLLKKKSNYIKIILIIKKYINYYLLLFSSNIIKDENSYKDTIIKLQKLSANEKILFNDDDSKNILNIHFFLQNFIYIINIFKNDNEKFNKEIKNNPDYKNILIFINKEINNENLNILIGDNINNFHNNIFFILIKYLYTKEDIKKVFDILEEEDNITYTYIDVIVPIVSYIDIPFIENTLNQDERKPSIINDLFYLLKYNENNISENNIINEIFNSNFIYPILDDFLRYHKDNELYDKDKENNKFDKNNTKIKYITNKVNEVQNYYNKNDSDKKKIDLYFYKRYGNRKAILYNNLEEINIIRKLFLSGKKAVENNEYINSLLDIRKYSYLNFNTIKDFGFSHKFNKTIEASRYSNIELMNPKLYKKAYNEPIENRVAPMDEKVNIVGFLISNNKLQNILQKDLDDVKNENKINNLNNFIYNFIKKGNNQDYYWIFDKSDIKYINNKTFNFNNNDNCSVCKNIIIYIYNIFESYVYDIILKKIKEKKSYLYDIYNNIYFIQNKYININKFLKKKYIDIDIYKNLIEVEEIKDEKENIIYGLEGDLVKLPKIKRVNKINNIIRFEKEENTKINNLNNFICQHHIDYKNINKLKKSNDDSYSEKLFSFIKKYTYQNNNTYLCKSCHEILDVKKYIVNIYSISGEEGINVNISSNVNLKDNIKYKPYNKLIDFIDKLIDKISLISKINLFIGNNNENKFNRRKITKKVIDLIIANYNLYIKLDKKEKEKRLLSSEKNYGISLKISKFFIFKLTEDIFKFKSKDEDKYKKRKINNLMIYIIYIMLFEINKSTIINLLPDKIFNMILFKKYFKSLFDNFYIKVNNLNTQKLLNYPVLCYYIYYFSCLLVKFNLWQFEDSDNKFDFSKVRIIIHSMVDLINHLCENNNLSSEYIFQEINSLFYLKQKTILNDTNLLDIIEDFQSDKVKYDSNKNVIKLEKSSIPGIDKNVKIISRKIKFINDKIIHVLKTKEYDKYDFSKEEYKDIYDFYLKQNYDKIVKKFDLNYETRLYILNDNELKKVKKPNYDSIIKTYLNFKDNMILNNYKKNKNNQNNYKLLIKNNLVNLSDYKDIDTDIFNKLLFKLKDLFNNEVYINKNKIFILNNQYIINHDINGNNIDSYIYIPENRGKITNNHSTFKQDVLEIIYKKYILYYNLYTNLYVGFNDKNNIITNKKNKFIRINYSLRNLFLLLGLDKKYHYVKDVNVNNYIYNLIKNRNNILKNIITEFIKILNSIKFNINKNNKIVNKFINKIGKININNIFNNYEKINNFKISNEFTYSLVNNDYINIIDEIKKSNNDKYFYYIIKELDLLFKNNNSNTNINIFKILIELILNHFNNNFNYYNTLDILMFKEVIYFDDISFFDDFENNQGLYDENNQDLTEEEQTIINEKKYSDEESMQALDYEVNEDDNSDLGEGEELIQDLD